MFSPILLLCLLSLSHSLGRIVNPTKSHCSQPCSQPVQPLVMGRAPLSLLPTPVGPQLPGSPLQKPVLQLLQCWTAGQGDGFLPGVAVAFGRGSALRVIDFNCSASFSSLLVRLPLPTQF